MEVINASKISKLYKLSKDNFVFALNEVNLVVNEGEFVAIMGPSGAGKSTLLNIISSIDLPSSGKVIIEGKKIQTMGEYELSSFRYQHLGFIFQNFSLIEILSNFENIAVPLTMNKEKEAKKQQSVQKIAEKLGIDTLLDKYPNECSGGQLQRVAIARALVTNPKIIIADEPTGNLDSKNSHNIMMLFTTFNQEGKTIIIVTHNSMVASYASRVLYVNDGKIEKEIVRKNKTKKEFFNEIVDVNSNETFMNEEDC